VIGATQLDGATRLTQLRGSASEPAGTELTEQAHSGCPGHAAHVHTPPVWGNEEPRVRVDFYCTDATGHGHVSRYGDSPIRANSSQERGGAMSEEQKAERTRVIVNNKAWDSATSVRLRWLKQFLAGKNAPKNADAFIARVIAVGSHDIRRAMESEHRTACALLGLPEPAGLYSGKPQPLVTAIDAASGARLKLLTLAALLGAHEAGTSRDSWRRGTAATRAYFQALASWGYQLSDVEQLVLSPDPDNAAVEASTNTAEDDAEDRTAHADQRDDSGAEEASGRGADVE
jgi:ParB family chromosome partitioning protein